jgi:hypothetical protein
MYGNLFPGHCSTGIALNKYDTGKTKSSMLSFVSSIKILKAHHQFQTTFREDPTLKGVNQMVV